MLSWMIIEAFPIADVLGFHERPLPTLGLSIPYGKKYFPHRFMQALPQTGVHRFQSPLKEYIVQSHTGLK